MVESAKPDAASEVDTDEQTWVSYTDENGKTKRVKTEVYADLVRRGKV